MRLKTVIDSIQGSLCCGRIDREVWDIVGVEALASEGVSLEKRVVFIKKQEYLRRALDSRIDVIIIAVNIVLPSCVPRERTIIRAPFCEVSFVGLLRLFEKCRSRDEHSPVHREPTAKVMPHSYVEAGTHIGAHVKIYPGAYIGAGVFIDDHSIIHSHAHLEHCHIGKHVLIHSGAVIGSQGFGYLRDGIPITVPHLGKVRIGNHVHIGANTCIDRAVLGETRIGAHTKIDNLVQVAHNCVIGESCLIASHVGIGGSTHIGNNVIIGGQAGVRDHVKIHDNAVIYAGSGVTRNVSQHEQVMGFPARPAHLMRKLFALLFRMAKTKRFVM